MVAYYHSWEYSAVFAVWSSFLTVLAFSVIGYHFYLQANESPDLKPKQSDMSMDIQVIKFGTAVSVFCYFCFPLISGIRVDIEMSGESVGSCYVNVILVASLYTTAKVLMYLVFVARASAAFKGSVVGYRRSTIKIIYALLVGHAVFSLFLGFMLGGAVQRDTGKTPSGHRLPTDGDGSRTVKKCDYNPDTLLKTYFGSMDVLITACLVYMFVGPLRKLLKATDTSEPAPMTDIKRIAVRMLPLKCMVVSTVGVTSTLVALSVSRWVGLISISTDCFVNICCLLLMTRWWSSVFWQVCGPLMLCVTSRRMCFRFSEVQRANLRFIITHFKDRGQLTKMLQPGFAAKSASETRISQ